MSRRALSLILGVGLLAANVAVARAASPALANVASLDVTPGLAHAARLRRTDPDRQMKVAISLALRNAAGLDAFIAMVSDLRSRQHGRYLTPAEFTARYSPTPVQVQAVADHLQANGLAVTGVSPNRTIVDASGSARAVEAAFGVAIYDWHDRDQNRDFYGNDAQPVLPAAIATYVVDIAGLNNHYQLHRTSRQGAPLIRTAAGPAGGFTPTDLRSAYDVTPLEGLAVPGSGQALGLFELDSFNQANITAYDTHYGLLTVPPTVVTIDNGPTATGGEPEVELDIEVMHALAPSAPITVWEGPNTDVGALHTYNAMVVSDTTPANSTSWGMCEPNTTAAQMMALDNVFKQAAAQGQSFFAASGDYGAYDCAGSTHPFSGPAVDNPADDPYVTGVGGTALTLNAGGGYGSELVWSDTSRTPNTGSGGGLSTMFPRPAWQAGPGVANVYSNGMRQVPDVALDADPRTGYSVYVTDILGTGWRVYGGTSASAPAWAAFTSLANQYNNIYGSTNLGFASPKLYQLGSTTPGYPPFHDITSGTNLYYPATAGWDFATGWGSFDAYNLARDLVAPPPATLPQTTTAPSRSETAPPAVPQSPGKGRLGPAPPPLRSQTSAAIASSPSSRPMPPSLTPGSDTLLEPISHRVSAMLSWIATE